MRGKASLLLVLLALLPLAGLLAHGEADPSLAQGPIAFDERLGAIIALDTVFTNDDGAKVRMAELVDRPTLLVIAYYRCRNECNTLMTGLAHGVRELSAKPGEDYRIVALSVNDVEGPRDALEKKALALASIEGPYPPAAWAFLTGDKANIDRLCASVGFTYRKVKDDFDHPLGVVVLSPKGVVVRYHYGTDFLPVDLSMSILEASEGIVRPTVAKMLRFCMNYDPASRRFGFNILRISGIVITLVVGGFILYLVISGGRKRQARTTGEKG